MNRKSIGDDLGVGLRVVSELVSELILKLIGDPDGCPLTSIELTWGMKNS